MGVEADCRNRSAIYPLGGGGQGLPPFLRDDLCRYLALKITSSPSNVTVTSIPHCSASFMV